MEIENEGRLSRPGEGERVRCKPQLAQRLRIETCVRLLSGSGLIQVRNLSICKASELSRMKQVNSRLSGLPRIRLNQQR